MMISCEDVKTQTNEDSFKTKGIGKVSWQPCKLTDWPITQVKHAFDISLGKMLQPSPNSSDDVKVPYIKAVNVQWGAINLDDLPTMWASPSEVKALNLKIGDLLVCEGGEVGRSVMLKNVVPKKCIYQNALHRVRSESNDVRYLKYCLKQASESGWFDVLCNRATIAHFTVEKFRELRLHIPIRIIQRLIADYLDRETARIDALVAEKEKMLALLEEKRCALISRAVTRGLDPDTPLKPSSAAWFDKTPTGWSVERLKWVIQSVRSGVSVNASDQPIEGDGFGVLKTSAVAGGAFIPCENKSVWETEYDRLACPVTKNTIIMSRMNTPNLVGESGYVAEDHPNLFLPDRLWQISFDENRVFVPFLALLLSSKEARNALSSMATGTSPSMKNLAIEEMSSLLVPVPPLEEQILIYQEVAKHESMTNPLRSEITNSLQLLKERRSALITAAVTGQIPVEEMHA